MTRIISKHKNSIIFTVCLLATRWSMADQYRVPTESMLPTIQVGDHVLVNKMAYSLRVPFTKINLISTGTPSHGDIVVFEYPHNPSINYVKRLIALPGDHVQIQDGFVKVNGQITLHRPEELGVFKRHLEYRTSDLFYRKRMENKLYIVR